MCFAVERRALFRHLNFQKWREHVVFLTFWLRNVLRATMACTFSTSQLPRVVRVMVCFVHVDFEMCFAPQRRALFSTCKCALRHNGVHFFDISISKSGPSMWCLYILTWKCASRHTGMQFVISHLARWLRTRRRFSEPTFRPSGATNQWKTQCFATFLSFRAPASSFFWLFLFCDLLSSALLSSTLLCSLTLPVSAFHLSILSEVWPKLPSNML